MTNPLLLLFGTYLCTKALGKPLSYRSQRVSEWMADCSNTSILCSVNDDCPPGLFCTDNHCECGVYPEYSMYFNGRRSMLLNSYCISYDEANKTVSIGSCLQIPTYGHQPGVYQPLPTSVHELNEESCGLYNRTGKLCGSCLPYQYPLAYSYATNCIFCPHVHWNWFRYIMAAYIPLTVFFLIIVFFKINITSSHLFPAVFYCQSIAMPIVVRSIGLIIQQEKDSAYYNAYRTLFSLYGIWNLDFFRLFYSDLCLGIGILPTVALDYAIAVYPLFLIVISYFIVLLHDRQNKVVTLIFYPFKQLLNCFKHNWSIKTSMIDAYATFFVLSNMKILNVSFDLLVPTELYELHPDHYKKSYGLFYAADVQYFGKKHLPYAIVAIVILIMFVILPVALLTFYPFMWFQRILNLFPLRWYVLHTFLDPLYGCYKDGTEPGTRDYRWMVSLTFILRILQFFIYFVQAKIMYNIMITVGLVFYTTVFAILQPFRSSFSHYDIIYILFFQALIVVSLMALGVTIASQQVQQLLSLFYIIAILVTLIPPLYFIFSIAYWFFSHKKFGIELVQRVRMWRRGYNTLSHDDDPVSNRENDGKECCRENLINVSS